MTIRTDRGSRASDFGSLRRVARGGTLGLVVVAVVLVAVLAVVTVGGALVGAGASRYGAAPDAGESPAVARGKQTYMSVCIACHGEHGEARPGLGKDLKHSDFFRGLTDEGAVAFLKQGRMPSDPLNTTGVQMPPKGGNPALSDQDLADIVAFVRALQAE